MPRFVILEHDHPFRHWDLMLEAGQVLRTWRLAAPPCCNEAIVANAVLDHRLLYLDYEGPISGGRGRVIRWESGTFTWRVQGEEEVVVHLAGQHLQGVLGLNHVRDDVWHGELRTEQAGS